MSQYSLKVFSLISIVIGCISLSSSKILRMESHTKRPSLEQYNEMRAEYLNTHLSRALGSDVLLNEEEQQFNTILMDLKAEELARGFENPFNFTPARHFFDTIKSVESSQLFKLIHKMPKGAVLHAHDTAMCSTDYVVSLTKWDNLWQWGEIEGNDLPKFLFSRQKPEILNNIEWRPVKDVRKEMGDDVYDSKIRHFFTLIVDNPITYYNDINVIWTKFEDLFSVLGPIVFFIDAWKDYYRQSLQEMYDDGVNYLEFRGVLPELYDLDGNTYGPIETCRAYVDVLKEFRASHPDFGCRFIYAPRKYVDDDEFDTYIPTMIKLAKTFPEFMAGFDLVGQEDKSKPLVYYAEKLLQVPEDIQFFFHAGETNWMGTPSDENLIDAVLLGSKRIGHGYAAVKYPHLLKIIKEKRIGIEVNPISNQVLKLVDDLRNHPASIFFSDDYPIVISSDDPSFWGALPLTHDFYFAFLGIASARQDLRTIKKLILNSFEFSTLNETQKAFAKQVWLKKWNRFIKEALKDYKSAILVQQ
ncbi:adenosine deaminase 2-like [Chironomus tepperi]|uniref:adenosine deaminase 2-like n=1 Tax=Chironomus tepperi TaxID=113505 RepID=UPI00391F91FE